MTTVTIGVLALQGAFAEHMKMLGRLGVSTREVRKPEDLTRLDGLIIPGGESTTMALVAERWGLVHPLRAWVQAGNPTWGTCAGMILLSDRAIGQKQGGQSLIGGLDVTVSRNYFGRQIDSFEADIHVPALGDRPVHAVFIRAPAITQIGPDVTVLASLINGVEKPVVVAVQAGHILATAFHPELTNDLRWHDHFVQMVMRHGSV